jgi:hypothetical protein
VSGKILHETLLRIEHKIDLLLERSIDPKEKLANGPLKQVGNPLHACPVCRHPVTYSVDVEHALVVRKCSCSTGKIAVDLKHFAPPIKEKKDELRSDEEDRDDPSSGRRDRRR